MGDINISAYNDGPRNEIPNSGVKSVCPKRNSSLSISGTSRLPGGSELGEASGLRRGHRCTCPGLIYSTHRVPSRILLFADNMHPERALQEQIERYRQMTGEQRLAIALELHELSCNVAREGIRRQNPNADEAEVERLLRQRLELARR